MTTVFYAIIYGLVAMKFSTCIKKHFKMLHALVIGLNGLIVFSGSSHLSTLVGHIGMALLLVVMYQGVFIKGSKLHVQLIKTRKEFAILGVEFLVTHFMLILMRKMFEVVGLISLLIMLPLFLTSFITIRKKMKLDTWRKLHHLAYAVYLLMFIHAFLVSDLASQVAYIITFVSYAILRVRKALVSIKLKKDTEFTS